MEGGYQRYMQGEDYDEEAAVKAMKVAHWRQISEDLAGCPLPAGRTLVDELQSLNAALQNLGDEANPAVGDGSLLAWRQHDLEVRHLEGPVFGAVPVAVPTAEPGAADTADTVAAEP